MNDLSPYWMIFGGLFAGILCVPFVTHWIRLLLLATGKESDQNSQRQPDGRVGAIVVAVLHPVPWVIVFGLPYGIFSLISNPPSEPWLWFFGSAAISFVCPFAVGFYVSYRRKSAA